MKKILTVYTGGTICCEADGKMRALNSELAKRALISNFSQSRSKYAKQSLDLFVNSDFPECNQTLSENMTLNKLSLIIKHIKSFDLNEYSGIIVMHGTDTLAYTASLFSFVFSNLNIPLMLVSGNRPPLDSKSNANDNFKIAVELIMKGITPNVYVPYKNNDGKMLIHLGSNIMQCNNFSDDFYGALSQKSISVKERSLKKAVGKFKRFKKNEFSFDGELVNGVLCINTYTGLDYSKISLDGIKAVVHGTYHSGTVCVERNNENEPYSTFSLLYFAKECEKRGVLLFVSPSKLDLNQYSSAFDLAQNSSAVFLNMTVEAAYMKAVTGVSSGFMGDELVSFMNKEINNEMID